MRRQRMERMQSDASEVSNLWHSRGGEGDSLLLLLHGLGANASVWDRMIPLTRIPRMTL